MNENEIDFEDVSLEPTLQVDGLLDDPNKPVEVTPVDPIDDPAKLEDKPEPKKRGPKPKVKDEPIEIKSDTTPEPAKVPGEETSEDDGTEDQEPLIQTMAKRIGIEIPEGMEFTDDEDGLIEFNEYVADKRADEKLNGFFENLPPIAGEFFDYLQMLGEEATQENIKAFFTAANPEIDYKSIDIENEDTQKAIMKTFYKKNGYTDADIKQELEDMDLAGTLKRQAERASKMLAANQEKETANLLEKERQASLLKKQNTQKFFDGVKGVLDSGKVNNFMIPATEKKALYDYDVTGQFGKDLNEVLKDPARRVELAIALKNKFNLNKYIQAAAATQKAISLRDKVLSSKGTLKGAETYGKVTNKEIDWDSEQ